jgi:hypothetical protein
MLKGVSRAAMEPPHLHAGHCITAFLLGTPYPEHLQAVRRLWWILLLKRQPPFSVKA